ncbi:hypothetical protein ACWFRJ_15725 [Streptomyces sp. NPDC055239]
MTPVLTSLVAVIGTLLGATLGYVFQRRSAARAERQAAVLAYANAIIDVIRSQEDWWYRRSEEQEGAEHRAARIEGHRLLGVARQAINGLTLHIPVAALLNQADATFVVASDVNCAIGEDDLEERSELARRSVRAFITLAGKHIK